NAMMGSIMQTDRLLGVELRHLLALQAVAREGSFGRAAIALGYTQSAVSQQIAALERIVGARLVERPGGPRPVSLTEAGELLLRHAEAIVARLAAAQADLGALAEGEGGVLRVGIYQSVGQRILPDLIGYRSCRSTARIESALRERLRFVFRSDHNGTVQGLVGAGVGAALVPRLTLEPHDESIVELDLGPKVPPRLIALAWHRDRYRTPAALAFVDTAVEVCAELQPETIAAAA